MENLNIPSLINLNLYHKGFQQECSRTDDFTSSCIRMIKEEIMAFIQKLKTGKEEVHVSFSYEICITLLSKPDKNI